MNGSKERETQMKSYLEIGKIVTLHGLRGDVKVQPWCDDAEFLCEFPVLYLGKEKKEVEVSHGFLQFSGHGARQHHGQGHESRAEGIV